MGEWEGEGRYVSSGRVGGRGEICEYRRGWEGEGRYVRKGTKYGRV